MSDRLSGAISSCRRRGGQLDCTGAGDARGEQGSRPSAKLAGRRAGRFWIGGDLQVNRIGLGTTEFTSTKGVVSADPASLRALLRRAVELGVNHSDCADVYGSGIVDGLCERFIYDALYPYPSDLIIATKGGQIRGAPGPQWQIIDGSPGHLRSACEAA